ncbi:flagellar hook capping FlgD N-terminal domain-containing protein [Citreimonas salinaria]|uniref:Basal-body rod modification protein FlgD n=1 Tax=Citreimonas salinaria TaxID=321339 RepID=A0A1H3EWX8_9RHOB|nr:flagellar hook capping FlgD N-terminal domain-containing protein [Citreimonas salinaria]SDX82588.1 flagellar basal-body rod modification protein FlgD [Citreimonas salinaria]
MTQISQVQPAATATTAKTTAASGASALSSDFETFLKMLTVQVQNQDPMNPVDSNDYATQLATFSSVEQQVLTNDLLGAIGTQLGIGSLQQVGAWIGMEALVRAPVRFDGTPVTVRPEAHPEADEATLLVRDPSGSVIERIQLEPGQSSLTWNGLDASGVPLPRGNYRFEVESSVDGIVIDSQVAQVFSRIEEVRNDGGNVLVRLSDGTEIVSTMVEGLRSGGA